MTGSDRTITRDHSVVLDFITMQFEVNSFCPSIDRIQRGCPDVPSNKVRHILMDLWGWKLIEDARLGRGRRKWKPTAVEGSLA